MEAVLFAAEEPLDVTSIAERLPRDIEVEIVLEAVRAKYEKAGFHLVKFDKKYAPLGSRPVSCSTKARG